MNRYLLLFVLFPAFAYAQQQPLDSNVYARARSKVDSFVRSDLGIGKGGVDLRAYNRFKNLFDVNATVQDDFNAYYQYEPKNRTGNYTISDQAKPFDSYAHNVALQVKSIQIDPAYTIKENSNEDVNGIITFTVQRKVTVKKDRKYVLPKDFAIQVFNSRQITFRDGEKERDSAFGHFKSKTLEPATYTFTSLATLTIKLKVYNDNSIRITEIISKDKSVSCDNDMDSDAIVNDEDSLNVPGIPGDFTAKGRPDYDFDGMADPVKIKKVKSGKDSRDDKDAKMVVIDKPDRCFDTYGQEGNLGCPMDYFLTRRTMEGFVGLQLNAASINLSELNQLGYMDASGNNATDVLQSKKGSLKNPGLRPGIYAGGNYTYYAGRVQRDMGISIGVNFTAFFADYQLSDPVMYTFKAYDSIHNYRRRITIDSLNESIRYSIFNFPVMFSYRFYIGKEDPAGEKQRKSVMNIKAGPSLMVFNTTSEYDAFISFEGLYQTNENGIIYKDLFVDNDSYNVFFTADSIYAQNPGRSAENVFRELRNTNSNYDFADSKNFRGKQKNESRLTVGFNLDINLQRQITTEWAFKLGLQAVYAPLPERKDKYIPINKTTDSYHSIYNSTAKSSYTAFGLHAGLVYKF